MNTLIAEDDFINRKILTKMICTFSNIDIAVDGVEAVAAFKSAHENNEPYDMILLDIVMPEKNGLEVLKEIREFELSKGIIGKNGVKIIMTTAVNDSKKIMTAFNSQCEAYIIKPINRTELLEKITELGFDIPSEEN